MNRAGHNSVKYFLGREVERTPAYGKKTLFVVGYHNADAIGEVLEDPICHLADDSVDHIFFGANDSYSPQTPAEYADWESTIKTFIERGYWCSLDIPFKYVGAFNDGALCDYHTFIPIIKVPVPFIRLWNYNTCVKIDDGDFAATNPGVWVHQLHNLMSTDRFTDWSRYNNDKVL